MTRLPRRRNVAGSDRLAVVWQAQILAALGRGMALTTAPSLTPERRLRKARQSAKVAAALLRLAPPGLRRKARGIDLALKGVRRMLAARRDADARTEAFARLTTGLSLPRKQVVRLERALAAEGRSVAPGRSGDLDEVARRFAAMRAQIEAWTLPDGAGQAVARTIAREYRRLRRDVRQALSDENIEALHELRKRVIRHRHHLALVAAVAGGAARGRWLAREARAKALGVVLGRHRDDSMLDEALRSRQDATLHKAAEAALGALVARQEAGLDEARRLARAVTRRRARHLARRVGRAISGPAPP